jgi:UDP-N-acetylglucosamine:LPS N-acetylglucosamine transferase
MKVLLVCSSGGHLGQLHHLESWWRDQDRTWVTFRGADSESLLAGEQVEWAHHPTTRNIPNMLRNMRLAVRLLRRDRPDMVVSTGAGVAFPFFVAARLMGVKTAFIEVYDRIDSATLTGRLCYRLTNLFVLQWEEQRANYPKGVVIGGLV